VVAAVAAMKAGAKDDLPKGDLTEGALRRAVGNAMEMGMLESRLAAQRRALKAVNHDQSRKNRELRSFYHVVSHELKTPLTVIREFTAILLDGLSGPVTRDQCERLGLVRDNCDRMTTMIDDLLDFSRLEDGKLAIHPEPLDVGGLALGVVQGLEPVAEARRLALSGAVAPRVPVVRADPARIRQVLHNLVANALKFTPAGGRVHVTVVPGPGPAVAVTVEDTGVGIPPEALERVFERFYQVAGDPAEHPGGLGLGLTLCRGLVALHGGTLQVTSTPGRGSAFRFSLAIAGPQPREPRPCPRS